MRDRGIAKQENIGFDFVHLNLNKTTSSAGDGNPALKQNTTDNPVKLRQCAEVVNSKRWENATVGRCNSRICQLWLAEINFNRHEIMKK